MEHPLGPGRPTLGSDRKPSPLRLGDAQRRLKNAAEEMRVWKRGVHVYSHIFSI